MLFLKTYQLISSFRRHKNLLLVRKEKRKVSGNMGGVAHSPFPLPLLAESSDSDSESSQEEEEDVQVVEMNMYSTCVAKFWTYKLYSPTVTLMHCIAYMYRQ